jgi:hypothetical protein
MIQLFPRQVDPSGQHAVLKGGFDYFTSGGANGGGDGDGGCGGGGAAIRMVLLFLALFDLKVGGGSSLSGGACDCEFISCDNMAL